MRCALYVITLLALLLESPQSVNCYSLSGTRGIFKTFQKSEWFKKVNIEALKNVSAIFPPGITALCGPSGSGKSTLSKIISSQYGPDKGELVFARDADTFTVYIDPLYYLTYDSSKEVGSFFRREGNGFNEAAFSTIFNILSLPIEKTVSSLLESQRKMFEILLAFYRSGLFLSAADNSGDDIPSPSSRSPPGGLLIVDEYFDKDLSCVRDQIFQKLRDLCKLESPIEFQVIVVTHSKTVCRCCDSVVVIRNGVIYNQGPSEKVVKNLPPEYVVLP